MLASPRLNSRKYGMPLCFKRTIAHGVRGYFLVNDMKLDENTLYIRVQRAYSAVGGGGRNDSIRYKPRGPRIYDFTPHFHILGNSCSSNVGIHFSLAK